CRDQRRAQTDTRTRTILRRRSLGHMDVNVALLVEVGRDPQAFCTAAYHGHGSRHRLGHHITQRSGLDQHTLAGHHSRLDGEQLATYLGPGQAGHLTDLILLLGKAITMLAHTEEMLKRLCRHSYLEALLADVFLDCLAANLGDLPL